MSASTSKLEMSLDEIIKAQKGKGNNSSPGKKPSGGAGAKIRRSGGPINKRRQVLMKGGGQRRSIGSGGINKNRINQGKRLNITTIAKKRIGGGPIRRGVPRRQPIVGGINRRFVRKNVPTGGNNRAMVSATKNLVKKLVKKALAKNVANTSSTIMAARQGKLVRIPANRLRQRRPIMMLNRISARSRVIGRPQRQRIVAMPQNRSPIILQQQPAANVRGRGPIRFATGGPVIQSAARRVITLPKRRRNNINNNIQYVQQQPAPIAFQSRQQQAQPQQLSVRGQINAMRRATRVQQLNTQFLKQQSQPAPAVFKIVRQQQPQIMPMMNRRPRQRPQQQQAPPARGRGRQQQFFAGRRGGGQQQRGGGPMRGGGQQVIQLDPMYVPPNYLQRI